MRMLIITLFLTIFSMNNLQSAEHGEIRQSNEQAMEVWNNTLSKWTGVEAFWNHYADSRGGITWGKSKTYPEYDKVKEFDTLLIELPQGVCLMEFFHSRWRRANDVRRWDDRFNQYGACPVVFN